MRTLHDDSRFILAALVRDGVAVTGRSLGRLGRAMSRSGQLSRQLKQLEAAGLIGREGSGPIDDRIFRLTSGGHAQVFGSVEPEKLWARDWSGLWTIVAFDVPESQIALRARLRRQLRLLRFGWLQNSLWISPDPAAIVSNLMGGERIEPDSFFVFEARAAGGESGAKVAAAAWDFARLEQDYSSYRKILELRPASSQRDPAKWKKWSETERRAWRRILATDPFLPEALLPVGYSGRKAWRLRVKVFAEMSAALIGHDGAPAV